MKSPNCDFIIIFILILAGGYGIYVGTEKNTEHQSKRYTISRENGGPDISGLKIIETCNNYIRYKMPDGRQLIIVGDHSAIEEK